MGRKRIVYLLIFILLLGIISCSKIQNNPIDLGPEAHLFIDDQLIFYYGCSSYGKNNLDSIRVRGGGIFRSRLRLDGFVSADAGSLTTKFLSFSGSNLYVNAIGPITIEVLNASGNVLGVRTIAGDSISHHVTFNANSFRATVEDNTARLRFTIADEGRLYSFKID